jgi:hypothetical protein
MKPKDRESRAKIEDLALEAELAECDEDCSPDPTGEKHERAVQAQRDWIRARFGGL